MFAGYRERLSAWINHRIILLHHNLTSLMSHELMCLQTAYVYLAVDLSRHAQHRNICIIFFQWVWFLLWSSWAPILRKLFSGHWLVLRSAVKYWPVIVIKTTAMIIQGGCYTITLDRTLRGPVLLCWPKVARWNCFTDQLLTLLPSPLLEACPAPWHMCWDAQQSLSHCILLE